jgi:hypothetical protein
LIGLFAGFLTEASSLPLASDFRFKLALPATS